LLVFECSHASNSERGDGAQEIRQLSSGPGVEMQISAVGQPGDLAEHQLSFFVLTFLQHEDGNLKPPKISGGLAEAIRGFLTGITDEDDGIDFRSNCFLAAVQQDPSYLCVAGAAGDRGHSLVR
jgi:hypothetical protein